MNNVIARLVAVGCALAGTALYAQDRSVVADIPFTFYMGDKAMAQGTYQVDSVKNGAIATLHSATAVKSLATMQISGNKEEEPPRLVFACYGGNCFLRQIWTGAGGHGAALPHSKGEKELASNGIPASLAVIKLAVR